MIPRIVLLSAFLTPFRSGAEACAEEIADRLGKHCHITIVTARLRRDLPKREMRRGVEIIRVGRGRKSDKWLFPLLAPRAAKRLRPDLIHAVLESYAGLAMVYCRRLLPRAKYLLTCQSTNTSLFLRRMHRSADAVTVISSVLRERALRYGRPDAVLIPNGVPYRRMREAAARHRKVPGRILFVGRLEKMKGVDTLLHAYASLVRRHHHDVPTMKLHIVGAGSQRRELEKLADDLNLHGWASFRGRLDGGALLREYAEAEIFCGLSRSEALGNVFLEAQAAGCAVVATSVGGIPDVVENGKTGLLVAPDDPACAADAVAKLLHDAAVRHAFAEEGAERAQVYDWDTIAQRYGEVYDKLLNEQPTPALRNADVQVHAFPLNGPSRQIP